MQVQEVHAGEGWEQFNIQHVHSRVNMVQLYGNKKWLFRQSQLLGATAWHALPAIFGIQVGQLHPAKWCLISLVLIITIIIIIIIIIIVVIISFVVGNVVTIILLLSLSSSLLLYIADCLLFTCLDEVWVCLPNFLPNLKVRWLLVCMLERGELSSVQTICLNISC